MYCIIACSICIVRNKLTYLLTYLDVDIADTGERLLRLIGSFPKARPVLGEVAENLCVRRGCPTRMSGADVRHGLFRRFTCRRFVFRRIDDSIVWGNGPYVDKP